MPLWSWKGQKLVLTRRLSEPICAIYSVRIPLISTSKQKPTRKLIVLGRIEVLLPTLWFYLWGNNLLISFFGSVYTPWSVWIVYIVWDFVYVLTFLPVITQLLKISFPFFFIFFWKCIFIYILLREKKERGAQKVEQRKLIKWHLFAEWSGQSSMQSTSWSETPYVWLFLLYLKKF